MQNFILVIIEQFGYVGVMFLIAIENVFPPIPSEVILLFSGFATSKTKLSFYLMIFFATLGSLIGGMILYSIGSFFNKDKIKKLLNSKWGKLLKLKDADIDRADDWFNKKGTMAVFICRFIPLIRSLISLPAGINKMNKLKFVLSTFLGAVIWNSGLILLGNKVGENWGDIAIVFEKYSFVILLIMISLFLIIVIYYCTRRILKKI